MTIPSHTRRRRQRWIAAIVLVLAVAVATMYWRERSAAGPMQYVTAPVTRGSVTRGVTASGSVNPVVTVQVGTYVSGVIQSLSCDFNTTVKKGQVCAKIDPRPYQSQVDQDKANLATAKAQLDKDQTQLDYTKASYDRTVGLFQQSLVSQDQLDSAKSTYAQAQAQVELDQSTIAQRQAELDSAQVNLGYTDIISPVNGTVISRNVTVGQTVAASFQTPTLFVIANDLTKMQVDANVSESDIGGISVGKKATFTVDAFPSRTFEGQVTQVRQSPQTVQNVVTYDVVVNVDNPDLLLKPGMTADVHIISDERDGVLRVPDKALRFNPGETTAVAAPQGAPPANGRGNGQGSGRGGAATATPAQAVWVLRNGLPERVPVTVGLDDDTNVEITSGALKEGDQVIVSQEAKPTANAAPNRLRMF